MGVSWSIKKQGKCISFDMRSLKPDSHRRIVKDYRPTTGKDHEMLKESV